jgi:hypothetical protein
MKKGEQDGKSRAHQLTGFAETNPATQHYPKKGYSFGSLIPSHSESNMMHLAALLCHIMSDLKV